MKVLDKFNIKGRGNVFTMKNDREVQHKGASLRRVSDGAMWPHRGVERYAILRNGSEFLWAGEDVGFLMPDDCDLVPGDEVEVVLPRSELCDGCLVCDPPEES